MQRELPFQVVLPKNYETSKSEFPVLYLLHGLYGSCENWFELTKIKDYLKDRELIVVLPDGENSWYCDSAAKLDDKFESSFINELFPMVETKYKIAGSREKRAVAGLSMGGYGAFKFALKRPDLFIFAGSMSGAFIAPRLFKNVNSNDWQELFPSISEVFGAKKSKTRNENDVFRLIEEMTIENTVDFPYFYFDCGTEDSFIESNRELSELFAKKNLRYKFNEIKGSHDWDYWNRQVRIIINLATEKFKRDTD